MRAAVYLRQSLDRSGQGDAVERQRSACRSLCEARGWDVVVEYVDNSVSATKDRDGSTAFGRLLADARAGRFDVVVAFAADRLARRLSDVERLIATGVKAATVQGGLDLTTPEGEAQAGILAAFARLEVRQKAERQRAAHAQRRERGLPPSGKRALGWTADGLTLVPVEQQAVADAAATLLAGGSLRSVARAWTAAGLVTADGRAWAPYSVRGVLLNPRTAGLLARRVGRDRWEVTGQGAWPPLLPEETWRAVGAVLSDPGRRTTPGTARVSLLSGLARCGVEGCGRALTTGGTRHGVRTLKCLPVLHLSRAAEPIEEYVVAHVLARLARPDAVDLLTRPGPDVAGLRDDLLARRARRRDLAGLLAEGVLSADEVRASAGRLDAEIEQLESRLTDAGRVDALAPLVAADDVAAAWDGLDLDARRAVVDLLCTVTVLSAGRGARSFDPTTVLVEPRH